MTSSTRPSDPVRPTGPNPRLTLAAAGLAFVAMLLVHLVMEPIASWAERERSAYLWSLEEWLALFTPSNHSGRGAGRLLLLGPSESREGFIPSEFDAELPGLSAYQSSQSMGTLEDTLVLLDYIEREYGESALPTAMLVGLTPRFVSSIRKDDESPLFQAIDLYAPHVEMDPDAERPALRERGVWTGWRATARYRLRQQRRYRSALKVLVREPLLALGSRHAHHPRFLDALTPSKYHADLPHSVESIRVWLNEPAGIWERVHGWDPLADRERITRDLRDLVGFAERHGIELFAVNLPEISGSRVKYPEGRNEAYFAIVSDALGDTPLLDLRTFLPDDEFFDTCHPVHASCYKVSDRIAMWMAETRASREDTER